MDFNNLSETEIQEKIVSDFQEKKLLKKSENFWDINPDQLTDYVIEKNIDENLLFDWLKKIDQSKKISKFSANVEKIKDFLIEKNISIRKKIIQNQYEIQVDGNGWMSLENDIIASLYVNVKSNGISVSKSDFTDILCSDRVCEHYNAVDDLLESVVWDGADYLTKLLNTVELNDEKHKTLFIEVMRAWFVASIATVRKEGINDILPIFVGEQGIGKTTFFQALYEQSKFLNEYFTVTNSITTGNKDSEGKLVSFGLVILDELDNLSQNQIRSLKSNLSKVSVSYRPAYGRVIETKKRTASFCGTANFVKLLSEVGRRFIIFEIKSIIPFWKNGVDYDQLWAQVDAIYTDMKSKNQTYHFNQRLIQEITQYSAKFLSESSEELSIYKYLEEPNSDGGEFRSTSDIAHTLWKRLGMHSEPKIHRYAQLLKTLGYQSDRKRIEGNKQRGYYVKFKSHTLTPDEIDLLKN